MAKPSLAVTLAWRDDKVGASITVVIVVIRAVKDKVYLMCWLLLGVQKLVGIQQHVAKISPSRPVNVVGRRYFMDRRLNVQGIRRGIMQDVGLGFKLPIANRVLFDPFAREQQLLHRERSVGKPNVVDHSVEVTFALGPTANRKRKFVGKIADNLMRRRRRQ